MSSESRHAREALQLHYFFTSQRFGDTGGRLLHLLWETCARVGMDTALQADGELSLPTDLRDGVGFLFLRQRADAAGARQAMLYRLHDVVGLTVMLSADEGPGRTAEQSAQVLRALERNWEEACSQAAAVGNGGDAATDPSLLGSVRVYRSLSVPDGTSRPDSALMGEGLRRELSPQSQLSRPVETENGLTLWEITRSGKVLSARRDLLLTTVATDQQEGLLDDWSWHSEHGGLVPLTRYLIGAALIRENYRVRLDSAAALSEHIDRLRRNGEELTRKWQELTMSSATRPAIGRRALARWERIAEQARQALAEERLASATTHGLRTMTRSLEVASAGLRVLGASADGRPRVLDNDEELRVQLAAVLDDDVTYLGIAREQVAEAARVATESAAQRLQSHQQYLSLIQTTVIGSVLLTLTAIQALAYKLPVPVRLHAPLIAVLGSLGLILPLLVVRRWRGGAGGRIGGVLEIGSLAVTGAAAGWLVGRALGHPIPSVLTGVVLLAVLGSLLTRKSSP
ncbi:MULTISPECIES: CATRA conflict system CASPASE/TPR repeat-associated protein [unclassified Streptomyces]|uniref:CATRA conflict system CASPASE/TPR repeat-associated protein n=1 Tax=unclassified Streptomyces TaxID=2593676 RepID=UPI001CD5AE0F|nr:MULTISPECIES: CATRA conflict system CASPASE/TPR repeat-associated protein [unclassified Streptomyces]